MTSSARYLKNTLTAALLVAGILLAGGSFAETFQPSTQQFQQVSWMEEAIFAVNHAQEPLDNRLARLEDVVLGKVYYNLSPVERIHQLDKALIARKQSETIHTTPKTVRQPVKAGKQPMGLEPLPPLNPPASQAAPSAQQPVAAQPEDGTIDYPILEMIEQRVFGQGFPGEELAPRLERVEKQVFGMAQRGTLYSRVDNLRLVVLGDTGSGGGNLTTYSTQPFPGIPPRSTPYANPQGTGYTLSGPAPAMPGSTPSGEPYEGIHDPAGAVTSDIAAALSNVEREVLRQTYPQESNSQRLDRLEMKIFNRTAPDVSEEERLQRVIAVAAAEGEGEGAIGTTTTKSTLKSLWPLIPIIILMFL